MKKSFSSYVKDYLMLAVLVALIILFSILGPAMANRAFFNFSNLLTMLNQNAYLVILGPVHRLPDLHRRRGHGPD